MYGSAEATSRMSYLSWSNAQKIGSIGKYPMEVNFFKRL